MAKTIKFFEDALKTNQVYPDIDPQGIYPGVTVGLAENLAEDYGEQKDALYEAYNKMQWIIGVIDRCFNYK